MKKKLNLRNCRLRRVNVKKPWVFLLQMGCALLLSFGVNAQERPNVVYIITDQWRASAFGYAGDPNVQTPNIDQLAKQSVNFVNAVTVSPVCTPHRASLFTGKYPTSTGMFLNDLYLPDEEVCMAEIYKSAGYKTAYLGKWHLDGHGRLNNVSPERRQGFEYWKALECSHDYNNMPYYDNDSSEMKYWDGYSPFSISKDAQNYIVEQSNNETPFLLVVSIATPHFPHGSAPREYKDMYPESEIQIPSNVPKELHQKVRKELNGYYAHCTATDKAIGELLDKIKETGLLENTIIVFSADHGEMMGAHGVRPNSKQMGWDESIRVPFLVRYPSIGKNKGAVVNAPITTPEILPSLLNLSGIKIPKSIEGEDLSWLIKSPDSQYDRAALVMNICPFTSNYPDKEFRGVRTKQFTYLSSPEGPMSMFDNLSDPYQMNNLIGNNDYKEQQEQLQKSLENALIKIGDNNFKPREYYLNKWNLELNKNGTHIDYHSFTKGSGRVQTPKKSN